MFYKFGRLELIRTDKKITLLIWDSSLKQRNSKNHWRIQIDWEIKSKFKNRNKNLKKREPIYCLG